MLAHSWPGQARWFSHSSMSARHGEGAAVVAPRGGRGWWHHGRGHHGWGHHRWGHHVLGGYGWVHHGCLTPWLATLWHGDPMAADPIDVEFLDGGVMAR